MSIIDKIVSYDNQIVTHEGQIVTYNTFLDSGVWALDDNLSDTGYYGLPDLTAFVLDSCWNTFDTPNYTTGIVNDCASTGVDPYTGLMLTAPAQALISDGEGSFCFWFKTNETDNADRKDLLNVFCDENSNLNIYVGGSGESPPNPMAVRRYSFGEGGLMYQSNYTMADDEWHFIGVGFNTDSSHNIYLDGSIVAENVGQAPAAFGGGYIRLCAGGIQYIAPPNRSYTLFGFTGLIDQIRIFSKKLEKDDYDFLWNGGSGR